MTIPREAILKAIEGGWRPEGTKGNIYFDRVERVQVENNDFIIYYHGFSDIDGQIVKGKTQVLACDPSFWQALGKSLRWKRVMPSGRNVKDPTKKQFEMMEDEWKWNAHRFYDILLTKQPTDMFWAEILQTNK